MTPGAAARGRAVMVCGTSSGAGKSLLVTALARWYARRGYRVAPFKAQNMSNNARVVEAGEIGSAQYFQALAARCVPDVRMNPVLLKPERDDRSQVIVLGQRRDDLAALAWRERAVHLWPVVVAALEQLLTEFDVVVIEGAGSAAEINLSSTDIVNMRIAEAAQAATLIICDIDRGGAFAHLYGTHQLLAAQHRALLRGFVLNKFRGDAALLEPGPSMLETLTRVPTIAVLPLWRNHGLPEEDGVFGAPLGGAPLGGAPLGNIPQREVMTIAIVAYPHISNLDEFAALNRVPGLRLRWAHQAREIGDADILVLPGSKHVASDLEWMRIHGLAAAVAGHVAQDKPTLAICGGLQMLGQEIADPHGVEAAAHGLGLLPIATEFQAVKTYRRGLYRLLAPTGFWAGLAGLEFAGYEIRHGATRGSDAPGSPLRQVLRDDCGWQRGQTLAIYVHGLLESPKVLSCLFGQDVPSLDATLDGLADFVERHFGAEQLLALLRPR